MRFMVMRKADAATEAGLPPSPAALADMEAFNRLLAGGGEPGLALGLRPSRHAVRLALGPDGERVEPGPFPAPSTLVAGFTVFEAQSQEAALALLSRWPARDGAAAGGVLLELRETGCPGGCARVPPAAPGEGEHYVILLRSSEASERDAVPPPARLDALDAFNAAQAAAGVLLAGDGLKSSSRGARLTLQGGRASVIDGPFAEAKELIAGFWLIRAQSMQDAIAWARALPYPTGPRVEVEIRQAQGMDEPAPALSASQARLHAGLRAEQLDAALRAATAARPAWR